MAKQSSKLLDRLFHSRALSRWTAAAKSAPMAELETLRTQRQNARQLRGRLNEVIHVADSRLALPRVGSNAFPRPPGTHWSWRPNTWRGPLAEPGITAVETKAKFGQEVTIFHDCKNSEITLRQLRNTREEDLAPFALRMDVLGFDGGFLSLVLDLPLDAAAGVSRRHVIRLNALLAVESRIEIFARLNIKHGPNTEQMTVEIPTDREDLMVEFDLAYADINEQRVERMWLDLIFEGPAMNQITLRDLTFCRYPRAEL
ncbi:DUF6478 family protein [Yoonia sp. 208BN28-4]|uniref:DUF6478 family protein n=1 Tax=Yoonia sp. 208BN28-4 TaxID=3126505 RepID=UPI0030A28400